MTVVSRYNTSRILTTVTALLLSVLACSVPVATTVPSARPSPTTVPTVTAVTPDNTRQQSDNTPEWQAVIERPVVNVRAAPDGRVVAQLRAGASVEIRECTKTWCRIVKPAGWVWRGCLSDNPAGLGCQAK